MLSLSCVVRSQSASPTPPPADATDIVKISTTLIQIDVTVRDRKGRVVTDLRPDEIEVYENGKKQVLTNFSFISNVRSAEEIAKTNEDKKNRPVVLPPSEIKADQVRRTIALVVDDLGLSFESTYQVRRALKKFVDEQMQEGDLVAIIRTAAGIGSLQQFTNDKRQLHLAIDRVRWNAMGRGGIGAFEPLQRPMAGENRELNERGGGYGGFQREFEDYSNSVFTTGTLGAIEYVVRGMEELPGRKSVLLLSDGFRLVVDEDGFRTMSNRALEGMRRLVDSANRASVVISTMDARGLQYFGLTAADDPGGRTPQQLDQAINDRRHFFNDSQDGLNFLAKKTGGVSIYNSNDLSGGIRKILDDQSYYLIGYQPDSETFDPRTRQFNNLEIKVTRPDTQVRHRSGFFGEADRAKVRPTGTLADRMFHSLSSPFAVNDITLRLNASFHKPPNFIATFIRSLVHIPGKDLTFTDQPNGTKKAVFDIIAAGFGESGVVVDQVSKTYTVELTKDAYERAMKQGLVYQFSFPVTTPGVYVLRIALHDHGNDKIGSANQFVEVPNLKKKRMFLSGAVLDNIPYDEYQRQSGGQLAGAGTSDPMLATSLRQFKRGTVLSYSFNIYNAKLVGASPNLTFQTRVFRDGQPIFESKPEPVVPLSVQHGTVAFSAALALGTSMLPGDYVLQVVITDSGAKGKTVQQFVTFEITE